LQPASVAVPGPELATAAVQVWLTANVLVLVSDPLQMLMYMTQPQTPTRGDAQCRD